MSPPDFQYRFQAISPVVTLKYTMDTKTIQKPAGECQTMSPIL